LVGLPDALTNDAAEGRQAVAANHDAQDEVDAFFARQDLEPISRTDPTASSSSEQFEELLDELADDLGRQWWEA
jgi:hypothetical protein